MADDALSFYNQLAANYHLIFTDWDQSIERQGAALDRVIRSYLHDQTLRVLDCAAGIGTQAIGLARRGYAVHATDLSPAAIARAAQEAARRGVALSTGVADLRALAEQVPGVFDVVLACDNALPHLLEDAELRLAAENMRARLRPGGLLLLSIRDYDQLRLERPRTTPPVVVDGPDGRRIVFQVWDWAPDNATYTLELFLVQRDGDGWRTSSYRTRYRALERAELDAILAQAGFMDLRWHLPQDTGFHQPLIAARPG